MESGTLVFVSSLAHSFFNIVQRGLDTIDIGHCPLIEFENIAIVRVSTCILKHLYINHYNGNAIFEHKTMLFPDP